jgi:hypothetical protein
VDHVGCEAFERTAELPQKAQGVAARFVELEDTSPRPQQPSGLPGDRQAEDHVLDVLGAMPCESGNALLEATGTEGIEEVNDA